MIAREVLRELDPGRTQGGTVLHQPGQQVADEQVRGGLGAHVYVVTHGDPLGGQGEQIDRSGSGDHLAQQRAGHLTQETQALDRRVGVPAEPRDLAGSLIDRSERHGGALAVLHHPDRGRRADRGRHRHHHLVEVRRLQTHVSRCEHAVSGGHVGGPTLRDHCRPHRTAQRITDLGPLDGGTAVQQRVTLDPRDHVGRRRHPGEHRHPGVESTEDLGVRLLDRGLVHPEGPGEGTNYLQIAIRRHPPVDLDHRAPLLGDGLAEERQPDIDHLDVDGQIDEWVDERVRCCGRRLAHRISSRSVLSVWVLPVWLMADWLIANWVLADWVLPAATMARARASRATST